MNRRVFSVAAACLMTAGAAMAAAPNAADFAGGTGTVYNPYQIATRAQLEKMAVGKDEAARKVHYKLTADIDLGGKRWTPLGPSDAAPFCGKLHGAGHKIYNLNVEAPYAAFIAYGSAGLLIDSLHLVGGNSHNTTTGAAAAFVCWLYQDTMDVATISHCSSSVSVLGANSSTAYVAAFVANVVTPIVGPVDPMPTSPVKPLIISDCVNYGTLLGGQKTGGIVAYSNASAYYKHAHVLIERCANMGTVLGYATVGGIAGDVGVANESADTIRNCYNAGTVGTMTNPSSSAAIGGIAGSLTVRSTAGGGSITVENCLAWGTLTSSKAVEGALVGKTSLAVDPATALTITNSVAAQEALVGGGSDSCSLVGTLDSGVFFTGNLVLDAMTVNGKANADTLATLKTSADLKAKATYEAMGWDFAGTWQIAEGASYPYLFASTAGISASPAFIKASQDTVMLEGAPAGTDSIVLYYGEAYKGYDKLAVLTTGLSAPIIYAIPDEVEWPTGKNCNIYAVAYSAGKLPSAPAVSETFATRRYKYEGKGTEAEPYLIKTRKDFEGLSSYLGGSSGNPSSNVHFALANDLDFGDADWTPMGLSSSSYFAGKLHGRGHKIYKLNMTLAVANSSTSVYGGLFGYLRNGASIDSLHIASGYIRVTLKATTYLGGIVGYMYSNANTEAGAVRITGCTNAATITGCATGTAATYIGGIAGYATNSGRFEIIGCINYANIGGGRHNGGIIGYDVSTGTFTIADCANFGDIHGTAFASGSPYGTTGGIVGCAYTSTSSTMTITNCYSIANLTSEDPGTQYACAGGIIGLQATSRQVNITSCYAAGRLSGKGNLKRYRAAGIAPANDALSITSVVALQEAIGGRDSAYVNRVYALYDGEAYIRRAFALADMQLSTDTLSRAITTDTVDRAGTDVSRAMAQTAAFYTDSLGWAMDTVWNIREGKSYPYLRSQSAPLLITEVLTNALAVDVPAGVETVEVYDANKQFIGEIAVANGQINLITLPQIGDKDTLFFACTEAGKLRSSYATAIAKLGDVPATSLTLSEQSHTLSFPGSFTLTATLAPVNTTPKTITWESSNTAAATVADGVVTAVNGGTALIIASSYNGMKDTCTVTVTVPVTGVSVSPRTAIINVGETQLLTANVLPSLADNKNVTWSSADQSLATVDANGLVTGVSGAYPAGTKVKIVVTTAEGNFTDTATVTVIGTEEPNAVAANRISVGIYPNPVAAGSDITLALPNGATGCTVTIYTVGGTKVAEYRNTAVVPAPAQHGLYVIVVALPDGKTGTQKVTVK